MPRFLMHINHVETLDLSNNIIQGTIPQWIWEMWDDSLTQLNLSNNMFTHMQLTSYLLAYSRLDSLDLSSNRLQGQAPMPKLLKTVLDYSNNRFSSIMPNFTAYLSQTVYLKLSRNNISGHIPHSVCDASNLSVLDLSYNNFGGLIPSCLIEGRSLAVLNLRENHFEGTLSDNVSDHCILLAIDLHGNNIQGQLPRSLSNCANLGLLDIGNNRMVDTFPFWLGRLSDLHIIVLGSNRFYGSLTYPTRDRKSREYFSKLQIIDIASNNFSGNLDPQWFERFTSMMAKFNDTGHILSHQTYYRDYHDTVAITYKGQYVTFEEVFTTLTAIDFSNNALEGDIPESVGSLVSLHILNMSHNAFKGRIPAQIGEMRQLESLDLSWNKLSGEIPQELTNLIFLSTLNLSGNRLDGRIPQSRQFATFENNSYEGNTGLCGPPLIKPCGNSSNPNEVQVNTSRDHVDIILFLFVGVGFGVRFTADSLPFMSNGTIATFLLLISVAAPKQMRKYQTQPSMYNPEWKITTELSPAVKLGFE
ncbi:Receptor-like protein 12 [Triticum urartu]|uniref:Receptor-like protein 12 n=1 Tax=Triticum urartu TaxID=4572 RepID=M7ZD61_TRIUA|nr:Receptor-like protein 12 [Triticum urartu]